MMTLPRTQRPAAAPRVLAALTIAMLGAVTVTDGHAQPATRVARVVDTLHGEAISDPYRWLEAQGDPEVLRWISDQNAHAQAVLGPDNAMRRALRARLTALLDVPSWTPPRRVGDWEYFTLRRRGEEVAAIYRRPWREGAPRPVDPDSSYDSVISPLARRADGTTSVTIEAVSPTTERLLYSVRDGGGDEISVHIRDLRSGQDLPDSLPTALYASLAFDTNGDGIYYVHRSRIDGPRYRYHRLGTPIARDPVLFGDGLPPTHFLAVAVAATGADAQRYRVYTVSHGWARNELFLEDTRTGRVRDLTQGIDAHFAAQVNGDGLLVRTDWNAPRGRLLRLRWDDSSVHAARAVLAETADVLDAVTPVGARLAVTYLRDASHRVVLVDTVGRMIREIPVGSHRTVTVRAEGDRAVAITTTGFAQPSVTSTVDLETLATTITEPARIVFDSAAYEVEQQWTTSRDGTRVPFWVVKRRGQSYAPSTPALLHGYGGFAVSLGPRFDPRAVVWMEQGGIYVQATLRGGNEFGEAWHRGGMLENKQRVFDDFLGVAQTLVDRGMTSVERLAIRGGSNGGLLMGAAITQRPDLFRAAFVGVPDLDLVRFPFFVTHNNAPALLEYGDARRAEQFAAIRAFSPYQNVRDGVRYPAVMVQTGLNDTRVPPWQARRFTARLQAATTSGLPVVLVHDLRSGHAGGRSISGTIELATQEMEFLLRATASPAPATGGHPPTGTSARP